MTLLYRVGAAIAAGCLVAAAPAAGALAAPSPGVDRDAAGLDAAKQAVTVRIDGRLAALRELTVAIDGAKQLSSGHRGTLTALVSADQTGLKQLKGTVAAETTSAAVRADATEMVNGYRVYVLAAPQVRLTIAADLETEAVNRLTPLVETLDTAIGQAKQAGKDTSRAEAALADLRTQLAGAGGAISGKADALLAVHPGPDADAIHAAVETTRQSVRTARTSLKAAVADVRTIRQVLGG